jgi:hypothetical protein
MPTESDLTPNQQRTRYVTDMLAINEHYGDTEPQNIQDLLSDLMHLCNGKGYDFSELLRVATDNFNGEVMDAELERGEQTSSEAA